MLGGLDKYSVNLPFSKSSCSHLYGVFLGFVVILGIALYEGD